MDVEILMIMLLTVLLLGSIVWRNVVDVWWNLFVIRGLTFHRSFLFAMYILFTRYVCVFSFKCMRFFLGTVFVLT